MKRLIILALALVIVAAATMPGGRTQHALAAPPGAATNMTPYNLSCNAVSLQWSPSGYGQQQWVDLSHWNGYYWQWDEGGPLGGYTTSFQWSSLIPGTTFYVRIDTGTYDGYWLASDWVRFDTPNCGPVGPVGGPTRCGGPRTNQVCMTKTSFLSNPLGAGTTYSAGEAVTICYDVASPMYFRITSRRPDGTTTTVAQGFDDGPGDCITGTLGNVPGRRDVTMYNQNGQVVSSTWYSTPLITNPSTTLPPGFQ